MRQILVIASDNNLSKQLLLSFQKSENIISVIGLFEKEKAQVFPQDFWSDNNIEWIDTDIMDVLGMESHMQSIDVLYHVAAPQFFDNDTSSTRHNQLEFWTEQLVDLAIGAKVKRIIYLSSAFVLKTKSQDVIIDEQSEFEHNAGNTLTGILYRTEQQIWRAWAEGVEVSILHPSLILDANPSAELNGNWFQNIQALSCLDPSLGFDFIDIRDVLRALKAVDSEEGKNERFVLSEGHYNLESIRAAIFEEGQDNNAFSCFKITLMKWLWKIGINWSLDKRINFSVLKELTRTKKIFSNAKSKKLILPHYISVKDSLKQWLEARNISS